MNLPSWLIPPLCVVGGIAWWSFVCCAIAFVSGWNKLAKRFRADAAPTGQTLYMQSARLNGSRYNNCLILIVAAEGLYLKAFPLFRPGHPPLLLPWSAFSPFKTSKQLLMTLHTTTVTISQFNKVTIAFYDPKTVAAISAYLPTNHES